jgi:hypothetical protein
MPSTIKAAGPDGLFDMHGQIALLPIGDRKVRFLIERAADGSLGSLTHAASGRAFARSLKRFGVSFLVQHGTWHRKPTARELAIAAITDAVHTYGVEGVLSVLDAAPVVNK